MELEMRRMMSENSSERGIEEEEEEGYAKAQVKRRVDLLWLTLDQTQQKEMVNDEWIGVLGVVGSRNQSQVSAFNV